MMILRREWSVLVARHFVTAARALINSRERNDSAGRVHLVKRGVLTRNEDIRGFVKGHGSSRHDLTESCGPKPYLSGWVREVQKKRGRKIRPHKAHGYI